MHRKNRTFEEEFKRRGEIPCLSTYKYVTRDIQTRERRGAKFCEDGFKVGHWKIHIFTSYRFQWWIPCNICMSLKRAFCAALDAKRWFPIPKLVPRLFNHTVEYTRVLAYFLFHTRFSQRLNVSYVGKSSRRIAFKFYAHFAIFIFFFQARCEYCKYILRFHCEKVWNQG